MTDGNLVARAEKRAADRGWLRLPTYLSGTESLTHGQVYEQARIAAAQLRLRGVRPGDRVLVALPDTVVPAAHLRSPTACAPPAHHPVAPQRMAYGLFASGTTGRPKLFFHRHSDPFVYKRAFGIPALGLRPGDVTFSASKCYFAYGLGNSIFYPLLSGAAAILEPPHPTPDIVLENLLRAKVSVPYAVPSLYARLVRHPGAAALAGPRIAVTAGEVHFCSKPSFTAS